jgi:phospholipase/carboxylesterase
MWYNFPLDYNFDQTYAFDQQSDLQTSRQILRSWLLDVATSSSIPLERTILAGFSQGVQWPWMWG